MSMGGNAYTEAVQKELNLPFDSAERLKKGEPVDGMALSKRSQPVLHAMTENVLLEIQKTFDFFKATAASDRDRPHSPQRRRVARGRFRGRARGALRDAGRGVRSVQAIAFDPASSGSSDSDSRSRRRRGGRGPGFAKGGRPMIRINLLAADRKRKKKSATRFRPDRRSRSAAALILVLAALFIGLALLDARAAVGDARRPRSRAAQQETARLHIRSFQQVQQFEQRKAQLQQRVVLIEQLRKEQTGPVHMLDQISRALPPMLWLTGLKADAEQHRASTSTASA